MTYPEDIMQQINEVFDGVLTAKGNDASVNDFIKAAILTERARHQWQPIETAPRDRLPFIALNHDKEVFVAMYDTYGRLCFRENQYREHRAHSVHEIDGEIYHKPIEGTDPGWENYWCMWTRGYEFTPTHWMPLPKPPQKEIK